MTISTRRPRSRSILARGEPAISGAEHRATAASIAKMDASAAATPSGVCRVRARGGGADGRTGGENRCDCTAFTRAQRAGGRIAAREADLPSQIVSIQGQGICAELDPFLRAGAEDEKARFVARQLLIARAGIGAGNRRLVLSIIARPTLRRRRAVWGYKSAASSPFSLPDRCEPRATTQGIAPRPCQPHPSKASRTGIDFHPLCAAGTRGVQSPPAPGSGSTPDPPTSRSVIRRADDRATRHRPARRPHSRKGRRANPEKAT